MDKEQQKIRKPGQPLYVRLASGTAWVFAAKIITSASALAMNVLLARLLEPAELGVYFLLLSFVAFGVIVANFGQQKLIVKMVAEAVSTGRHREAATTLWSILRFGMVSGLVIAAITGLAGRPFAEGGSLDLFSSYIWFGAALIFVQTILGLVAEGFRGYHNLKLASIFNGLMERVLSLAAILVIFLVTDMARLPIILAVVIGATLVSCVLAMLLMRREVSTEELLPMATIPSLMIAGWPLLVTTVMGFLAGHADLWIVAFWTSPEEVALYGAVVRLIQLLMIPMMMAVTILPSFITELYATGKTAKLEDMVRGVGTLAALPAIAILSLFLIMGETVLVLVYGQYYGQAYIPLIILSGGYLMSVMLGPGELVLIMTGHYKTVMTINLIFGALLIIGSVFVVRYLGMPGVAAVTAITIASRSMVTLFLVRRSIGIWTHLSFRHQVMAIGYVRRFLKL